MNWEVSRIFRELVKELLGHTKPETTLIYTLIAKKDLLQIKSPLDITSLSLTNTDKENKNMLLSGNLNG